MGIRSITFQNWGVGMHNEILIVLTLGVLTLAIIGSIFLAALIRLWREPPEILINIGLPDEFTLIQQKLPAKVETDKPDVIPLPENVLDYINLESDEWAREARKRRARMLYADVQDWSVVFRQLQQEDSPLGD